VADLPAGVDRIPLKSIHINRCPIVLTPKLVDDKVAERLSLDWPTCEAHRQQLLAFSGLAKKLQAVVTANQFDNSGRDAEALLYDGFIPNRDKPLIQKIPEADATVLADSVFPFSDARLPDLLLRYRARNFPDSLSADEQEEWLQFCRDKCLLGESSRLDKELENIDALLLSKPERSDVLNGLADFLKQKKQLLAGG
jgi:exodeoxyribonuclease-1